jgi:mono/diheme cytochrome c family protein
MRLLQMQGCVGCHSLDGSPSAGPSFRGRFGSVVSVRNNGELAALRFDRDYLAESVRHPDAALAEGFAAGVMPTFALTDEQLDAIVAALQELRVPLDVLAPPARRPAVLSWPVASALGAALLAVVAAAAGWRRRRRPTQRER